MNDNTFSDLFVSPHLCELLYTHGVTPDVNFQYRLHPDGKMAVCSDAFDPLKLYKLTILMPGIRTEFRTVPAYTITDMLSLMPEYEIYKGKSLCSVWEPGNTAYKKIAKRLPDAAALYVLSMIETGRITTTEINFKIN